MKKFSLKKRKLIYYAVSIALLVSYFSFLSHIGGYVYEDEVSCINAKVSHTQEVKNVVFKYENDKQEIIIYQSENRRLYTSLLYKRTVNGYTRYKYDCIKSTGPYSSLQRIYELGCFNYVAVDDKEDYERYDFGKYEPEEFSFDYTNTEEKPKFDYIYIVDTTKK